jgi:hypothetical protein
VRNIYFPSSDLVIISARLLPFVATRPRAGDASQPWPSFSFFNPSEGRLLALSPGRATRARPCD